MECRFKGPIALERKTQLEEKVRASELSTSAVQVKIRRGTGTFRHPDSGELCSEYYYCTYFNNKAVVGIDRIVFSADNVLYLFPKYRQHSQQ